MLSYLRSFQWIGCGMTVFVVDKFGRKTLLCISGTIMCISIFSMGTFFYLKENQVSNNQTIQEPGLSLTENQIKNLAWLPLVSCWMIKCNMYPFSKKSSRFHLLLTSSDFHGALDQYHGLSILKCFRKKLRTKERL